MTKFLLIRHATTAAVGNRLTGRTAGVGLNEEGQAQARKLAERLAGASITALYSSPMERAQETAASIARALNLETHTCEDFQELDFGHWTDRTFQDIAKDPQFQRFNSFRSSTRIPGGELMLEAQTRMITGMAKLCTQHPQGTIIIVSHSDMIKAAVAYYAGIHLDMFQRLEISPASISIIEVYEETARVLQVNDTGELKV
ncbi:histidine phosphatase family protein [Pontibacter chitinilyticus]|uniref:histidine phosphatase family protein n=1 Tax=Pontibacter chitinilyticus TaxID=2674989 RepID=UPI003219D000